MISFIKMMTTANESTVKEIIGPEILEVTGILHKN